MHGGHARLLVEAAGVEPDAGMTGKADDKRSL